jgi:hypothetical protein
MRTREREREREEKRREEKRRERGMRRGTCRDDKRMRIKFEQGLDQLALAQLSINSTQLGSCVSRRERHGLRDTPAKN